MPRKIVISGLFFPHGDIKYVENAEDLHIVPCPKLQEMTDREVEFLRKESMDADLLIVALFGTKIEEVERLGLPDIPAQKVLWAFDSHHCLENDLKYQHLFDKYFIAHSQFVKKFDKVPAYWIPSCYIRFDIDTLKKLRIRSLTEQHRINDVVFPGNLYNLGKRKELIEVIKKYFDRRQFKYHIGPVDPGMPYMNKILQSKVTLNLSLLGDLNIRNFEAWALNRPIITDMVEDFQKLQNVDMSMTYFFERDFSDFESALNQALAVKQVKDTSKAVLNNHMLIHRYIEIINISLDTNYYVKNVFGSHSESNINVLGQNSCSEPAQNINSLEIKNSPTVDGSLLQLLNTNSSFSCTQFYNAQSPVGVDFTALKHIVWLRVDSIGDVVLANSMIPYIRKLAPNAKITVICQDYIAELFQTCPYINNIVTFDRKQMLKDNEYAESVYSKVNQLDADCILNSVQSRNSICDDIIKYSNAPIRIGMIGNLTNCTDQQREERNKHYTHLINSSGCKTELDHHAEFIRALGCIVEKLKPIIWLESQSKKTADDWLRDNDLIKKRTIVLAAGAQSLNMKQYPHYGKAIVDICKKNGFSVVALGSKQDFDINQRNLDTLNAAGIRTFNLSGQTTIQQAAAVIDNCRLVVGLDNGLGHIACALEIPNVLILWGKHFGRFHPYSKYSSIVCLPLDCFGCDSKCKFSRMYCVDAVDPQVISHAVRVSLGSPSSKPRVFVQRKELFNPDGHECPVPSWKMFDGLVNMSSIEVVESLSEKHQSNSQKEPYLSIVVTSRNDDHGGNGLHRMQVFAKGLADQCRHFDLNAELIIVEWNPPAERKSLYEVLEWPLDLGPLTVRFIMVPKEIHNKIDNSDKFGLFQWIAKNVGIKRANGKFILSTNIDILFSDELIQFIASKQLNEDCFYRIDRHDVGCKRIPENLNTKGQLEFCNKNIIRIQGLYGAKSISEISSDHFRYTADDTRLHTNACGDFTLMARDKWHHFRGYPELGKGDLYIDGLIVHIAHVAGLKQVILQEPMRIYHIEHDEGWIARKDKNPIRRQLSLDYNKEYKSWCQKMLDDGCIYTPNGQDWGFASEILKECHVRSIQMGQCSNKEESKHTATVDNSELFQLWIDKFSEKEGRLYYRDQSSESLNVICNLVRKYKPTKIIELGTLSGMSLRTWLAASNNVEVIAVDLSFKGLYKSRELIPVDLTRVRLLEQNILQTDFSKLWSKDDRVIFYVDAHDLEHVPVMAHVLNNALPALPEGSCFVVDDLWYCPKAVMNENVLGFFDKVTTNEVDSLQCFEGYCAPYWKGGFFIGFREVVELLEYVNRNRIELVFTPGDKAVMFRCSTGVTNNVNEFDIHAFKRLTGRLHYNPVGRFEVCEQENIAASQQAGVLCRQGAEFFAARCTDQVLEYFQRALELTENIGGAYYAQAVCYAKSGKFDLALAALESELKGRSVHPKAAILSEDIKRHIEKNRGQKETAEHSQSGNFTMFSIPKPFKGHIGVIQQNAIRSWTKLSPKPEIILFGTEEGTKEIAEKLGLRYVPDVKRNEFSTPMVDDVFNKARELASNNVLTYINADIITTGDFAKAVSQVREKFPEFLMIGQRWDVDISGALDFDDHNWQEKLWVQVKANGSLHAERGIDYFVFTKKLWPDIPPFALGRTAWDNWFVCEAFLHHPVIDATESVRIVHQNHNYGHVQGDRDGVWKGQEARRNHQLAGKKVILGIGSTSDTTWKLTNSGLVRTRPEEYPGQLDDMYTRLIERGWDTKCALHKKYFESVSFLRQAEYPSVSVVVISWRLHPDTLSSLEILSQQRDENFELIFVDNGASPGEFECLKPYIDIYVRLNTNTGAYLSRNIGAAFASAPTLLFLDDDGIPERNLLQKYKEAFNRYEAVSVRGAIWPKEKNAKPYGPHLYYGEKPFPIFSCQEGNSAYNAMLFYQVGGWDDKIIRGGGGLDLSRRLLDIEPDMRKQIYSPQPVLYHGDRQKAENWEQVKQQREASFERLKRKHPDYGIMQECYKKYYRREDLLLRKDICNEITTGSGDESEHMYQNQELVRYINSTTKTDMSNGKVIALNEKGKALLFGGDKPGALNAFQQAVMINPYFIEAHNNLGRLYWQIGHIQKALRSFLNAFKIDPDNRQTVLNIVRVYRRINEIEHAERLLSKYLKGNPDDVEVMRELVSIKRFRPSFRLAGSGRDNEKIQQQADQKGPSFRIQKTPVKKRQLKMVGTDYGGWPVDLDLIPFGSTVISAGVGEDISFDLGLIRLRGCNVIGIDPTEKARRYVEKNSNGNFMFMQKALCAQSNKKIRIYKNSNPEWVSESIISSHHSVGPTDYYEADSISLNDVLKRFKNVSLLKMDIEGAEYEVLDSIDRLDIPQICIEFHHVCTDFTVEDTERCIERLKRIGYVIAHRVDKGGPLHEITFIHQKYINKGIEETNVNSSMALSS